MINLNGFQAYIWNQILKDNIENLGSLDSVTFLGLPQKAWKKRLREKEKSARLEFIKINEIFSLKDTVERIKRQPTPWV